MAFIEEATKKPTKGYALIAINFNAWMAVSIISGVRLVGEKGVFINVCERTRKYTKKMNNDIVSKSLKMLFKHLPKHA